MPVGTPARAGFWASCPAPLGRTGASTPTLAAAKKNLQEAVELYLETWGGAAKFRPAKEVYLTSMEVVG